MQRTTSPAKSRGFKQITLFFVAIFAFACLGLAPAFAVDLRIVDVVAVNWPGAAAPPADAKTIAALVDTNVNFDWLKFTTMVGDASDRAVSFKSGKVLDLPISLRSKMACNGSQASDFMDSIRPEAYKRLGVSDYSKRYLIVVVPKAGCVWSGRALIGKPKSLSGILILHNSASSFVITHELGHAFGLGHTNFLRCENAAYDGPWGETCKGVEYGGTIDVMGNIETRSPLSTFHQWRIGLLDDSQIKQVWQSEALTLAPSDFSNGIKAIFIRDGKSAYWIEYRRQLEGVGYKPGLVIYRLDPPPVNAVVSPNPEDTNADEFNLYLGSDVWMLNLDTYQYRDSRSVGGSMSALIAKTYSGDVSFSAVASETGAVVTITKKIDKTPPPVPLVIPFDQWISPLMVIIKDGNEDVDTAIAGYESSINGVVATLKTSDVDGWSPTYLSPLTAPKTVYLRDLPEGSYVFSLRAIDFAGNKSEWSTPMKVVIDRANPVVTNDFAIDEFTNKEFSVAWKGASDAGSGICQVNVVDEEGLVIQSSNVLNAPAFKVAPGLSLSGTAQVFDCLGNGLTGDLKIESSYIAADKTTRAGRWSPVVSALGLGALKCVGNCSATISAKGKTAIVLEAGTANVSIGGKVVGSITENKSKTLSAGNIIDIGRQSRLLRISGKNFTLVGVTTFTMTLGTLKEVVRLPVANDSSLIDEKQLALAKFGFRPSDFSSEWTVLPMVRGTTLEDPSLDLCNGNFTSEKDRKDRRQVIATKVGSTYAFLSTEVVKYSSAAAASAAQKELVKVLAKCQSDKGYTDVTGALFPYDIKPISNIPAGLVSEDSRVIVNAMINIGANKRGLLCFYQFNGDTFTGLYLLNTNGFNDAQVAKWFNVAKVMADRLQGKSD